MKATVAELEFTNKSQARVLQHQQASIVKQSQRNMRMTRVLAAMPRQAGLRERVPVREREREREIWLFAL